MTQPPSHLPVPLALVAHRNAVAKTLKQRLKKMEAVSKLHEKGMTPAKICSRRKVTRAELKCLMSDHYLYSIHAFVAESVYHPRPVAVIEGGRESLRAVVRLAKAQAKRQATRAGMKEALAEDPRKATFAQPINLYWAIVGYVDGTLFPAAKK